MTINGNSERNVPITATMFRSKVRPESVADVEAAVGS